MAHPDYEEFVAALNERDAFGSEPACFIGLDDLIAEKRHWGRPQDVADLEVLERALRQKKR